MRNAVFKLSLAVGALCGIASPAFAEEFRDATGATVELPSEPKRVVTLIPSVAEVLAAVDPGYRTRVVGVSEYTDYPADLREKKVIGSYQKVNLETVRALKPDLVLASHDGNDRDQILHLRELGLKVYVTRQSTLAEIRGSMVEIAALVGSRKKGEALAAEWDRKLATLEKKHAAPASSAPAAARSPALRKVLLQVGDEPLIVVGGGSYLDEVLRRLGTLPAFGELKTAYPRVSVEEVVERKPEEIIVLALGAGNPAQEKNLLDRMLKSWERFPSIPAVAAKRVRALRADELLRPGPRMIAGIEKLDAALYGADAGGTTDARAK